MLEVPVIDVFAGPGGLSEGFSKARNPALKFRVKLSVEKDPVAHRTLLLRAFARQFADGDLPEEYYSYIRGEVSRDELFDNHSYAAEAAESEAWLAELGLTPRTEVYAKIKKAVAGAHHWVLIGGPPCQAYSVIGRARMLGRLRSGLSDKLKERARRAANLNGGGLSDSELRQAIQAEEATLAEQQFHKDKRHQLYREYLEIVAAHQPTFFVMENVKGILSSKIKTRHILDHILEDLKNPWAALDKRSQATIPRPPETFGYQIHSFCIDSSPQEPLSWKDYVIECESYGVPQRRHRVILLGVRSDVNMSPRALRKSRREVSISDAIKSLPKLRSHISRRPDNFDEWVETLKKGGADKILPAVSDRRIRAEITESLSVINQPRNVGSQFTPCDLSSNGPLDKWYSDPRIGGIVQHRARGHMPSDLLRYLFAASMAKVTGRSPTLYDYPKSLLPDHKNTNSLKAGNSNGTPKVIFEDRFRVQVATRPAATITSHIAKDGHYYIHYDPTQCRSLTPREAARVQTFPDNYFFEGNRTEQYHQVGNAVPPFLACQLADVVAELLCRVLDKRSDEKWDD